MVNRLITLSPSRVTSALLPSGVNTMPAGPESALPRVKLAILLTCLPAILSTATVPSPRFATSASVPVELMAMPVGCEPVITVPSTLAGDDFRSISVTKSLLTSFVLSVASAR